MLEAADETDVSGRPVRARPVDLDAFFRPSSVAVIGASDTPGRPHTGIPRQLRAWAERVGARMYPVNPGRREVDGEPCYPDLASVPVPGGESVDLAVILLADPEPVI